MTTLQYNNEVFELAIIPENSPGHSSHKYDHAPAISFTDSGVVDAIIDWYKNSIRRSLPMAL